MDIYELRRYIPKEVFETFSARKIERLSPPQEKAIESGLLDGFNMVVASPTASGKTLIAEIGIIQAIINRGKKAVYVAPMKAIATEKYNEFKEIYPYIKSTLSIGDLDSGDRWISDSQLMFFSTEKLDSLIRHGAQWLGDVGCFVFDEVHMVGDSSRGPTMELLITRLKDIQGAQIIALSATIGNADEIAKWLNARLIESDYRPTKLVKGVIFDGILHCFDEGVDKKEELAGTSKISEIRVVEDTLGRKKQLIIFYATRKSAEVGAAKIAKQVYENATDFERTVLNVLGRKISGVLEQPTEQCIKLGSLVEKGVAFHHAGLLNLQRNYIEEAFREGIVKVICATTTLGYGINMPAHTVLVRDTTRFDGSYREKISTNEIIQLFGRAGRPKYDTEGRAIICAPSASAIREIRQRYIDSSAEPISSILGVAPVLRSHVLAFISEGILTSEERIAQFLYKSLYSMQYGNSRHIEMALQSILTSLEGWGFIERHKEEYVATRLGSRVSELYIDPMSAYMMICAMRTLHDVFDAMIMISNTVEMKPHVKAIEDAEHRYSAYLSSRAKGISGSSEYDYVDYDPIKIFGTAMMLEEWMEEKKEPDIVKRFSSSPGALYTKLTNADWLIYSAIELAKVLHIPRAELIKARVRLKYGIKEELLDLVRLEQVGRVRARIMYNNGIEKVSDIRNNREKVIALFGKEMGKKILDQIS